MTSAKNTYNNAVSTDLDTRANGEAFDDAIVVDENIFAYLEWEQDQSTVTQVKS